MLRGSLNQDHGSMDFQNCAAHDRGPRCPHSMIAHILHEGCLFRFQVGAVHVWNSLV